MGVLSRENHIRTFAQLIHPFLTWKHQKNLAFVKTRTGSAPEVVTWSHLHMYAEKPCCSHKLYWTVVLIIFPLIADARLSTWWLLNAPAESSRVFAWVNMQLHDTFWRENWSVFLTFYCTQSSCVNISSRYIQNACRSWQISRCSVSSVSSCVFSGHVDFPLLFECERTMRDKPGCVHRKQMSAGGRLCLSLCKHYKPSDSSCL